MLSLHIDNRPVELPPDFSVTMNLKSPIFGDVGSYSYPFKIPNNAMMKEKMPPTKDDLAWFKFVGLMLFTLAMLYLACK